MTYVYGYQGNWCPEYTQELFMPILPSSIDRLLRKYLQFLNWGLWWLQSISYGIGCTLPLSVVLIPLFSRSLSTWFLPCIITECVNMLRMGGVIVMLQDCNLEEPCGVTNNRTPGYRRACLQTVLCNIFLMKNLVKAELNHSIGDDIATKFFDIHSFAYNWNIWARSKFAEWAGNTCSVKNSLPLPDLEEQTPILEVHDITWFTIFWFLELEYDDR